MIKNKSLRYILLILIIIFTLIPSAVLADGGDGSGDGDSKGLGENKDIPLTLVSCSVKDNAQNVHLNETIQLNFNKNVCNVTVLSNNKMCFHLTDENGAAVAIKLIFPDTQVQRDYKREVFIIPLEDLEPNSQYRVSVDSTLTAKNGTFIDNAHTVTFTTGTERTDKENAILKELGDYIITYETAYSETADSVPLNTSGLDDVNEDIGSDTGTIAIIAAVILIAVIIAFTAFFFVFKRRKE